jgi:hypothetical protein
LAQVCSNSSVFLDPPQLYQERQGEEDEEEEEEEDDEYRGDYANGNDPDAADLPSSPPKKRSIDDVEDPTTTTSVTVDASPIKKVKA